MGLTFLRSVSDRCLGSVQFSRSALITSSAPDPSFQVYSSFNFDNGEVTLWPVENYDSNSKSVDANSTAIANTTQEAATSSQTNGTATNETSYVAYQPVSLVAYPITNEQSLTKNGTSFVAYQPTSIVEPSTSQVTSNYTEVATQPTNGLVITSYGIDGAVQTLTITATVPTATITAAVRRYREWNIVEHD